MHWKQRCSCWVIKLSQANHCCSDFPTQRRRGATLVTMSVALVVLVGIMALALEGGSIMAERRRAQAVADAAALAAACDLSYQYGFSKGLDTTGKAADSALQVAYASQYYNQLGGTSLTDKQIAAALRHYNSNIVTKVSVNIPPKLSADFSGQAGYAEVVVLAMQPPGLSAIFGSGLRQVTARAVARGQWQPIKVAFLALEPNLPAALTLALNASMTVTNGSVVVDSASLLSTAFALNGRISAPEVNLTGNYLSLLNFLNSTKPNVGVPPTPDPLAYLSPPDPTTLPVQGRSLLPIYLTLKPLVLQPGVYYGGIKIAGTASVTMNPGIYYMAGGGFTVADTASLTGLGVTIVNAPILPTDMIAIACTGAVRLTPPTDGLYAGITIMQQKEVVPLPLNLNPTMVIGANSLFGSSLSISGTIYAPQSIIGLAGNGTAKVGSQVICRMAAVAANASVQINWDSTTARTPLPVRLAD